MGLWAGLKTTPTRRSGLRIAPCRAAAYLSTQAGSVARAVFLLLAVVLSAAYAQAVGHNSTQGAAPSFTPSVVVSNFTALPDAARPDFVMDVNSCSIYVYVVLDSPERQDPLLHTEVVATKMSASPMYSGEVLEAFLKALGPRVTAGVWILKPAGGYEERALEVEARNAAELREAVEGALGIPLASNYTEALRTAAETKRPAAYLVYAERVVRRFIQLAGFCRSPMVAEFRPKTGFIKAFLRPDPTSALAAVVGAAATASAATVSILKRRRINPS